MDLIPVFDKNAAYIWTVYAIAFVLLGTMTLVTVLRARNTKRQLDRLTGTSEESET